MNKTVGKVIFGVSVIGMTMVGSSFISHAYADIGKYGMVTGYGVNIRSGNSLSSKVITQLNWNNSVQVLGENNGWYHIKLSNGYNGWIFGKYLSIKNQNENVSRGEVNRSLPSRLVELSKKFLGTRYIYGGSSQSGFDCSGFTKYVFGNLGIVIPRVANDQATVGSYVDYKSLAPGDLVFFKTLGSSIINHAGIYIGNGDFIHSSSGAGKVMISSLNSGYYLQHYATARRVIK